MKILHFDIDSLRPDRLGCYGHANSTSPAIDDIARQGLVFEAVHASDTPCLPSRTAFWSGRFGTVTGVVGHGGTTCEPRREGEARAWAGTYLEDGFTGLFRKAGFHCASVSSFGERHGAWHWLAGFNEIVNPGKRGMECGDEVAELALAWLNRAPSSDWYLHVNLWDPHTPYRTPDSFGDPFAEQSLPTWMTAEAIAAMNRSYGPHGAAEPMGWGDEAPFDRGPTAITSPGDAKAWIAAYDAGVAYADQAVGRICNALKSAGHWDETIVIVTADHGENLGELNVWGDHQTADQYTTRIPFVLRWPGNEQLRGLNSGLHYHFDLAAMILELIGVPAPENWHGRSPALAIAGGTTGGRDALILSHGAWSAQRSVRFRQSGRDWIFVRTYHAGLKPLPDMALYDLTSDPGETTNLVELEPGVVAHALSAMEDWRTSVMLNAGISDDPILTVALEKPFHVRGRGAAYVERLRKSNRSVVADQLRAAGAHLT